MKKITLLIICLVAFSLLKSQEKYDPSFEQVLSLSSVGSPILSPDGKHLVYSVSKPDWSKNRYDSELWLKKEGEEAFQLTNSTKGSSFGHVWSPDGQWILFMANRNGKNQLQAIRTAGGEAIQVSQVEGNIQQFEFSPDGRHISFTMTPKENKTDKSRKDRFGSYQVDDAEYRLAGLYLLEFNPMQMQPSDIPCYDKSDSLKKENCIQLPEPELLLKSDSFTINGFEWSPDGTQIAFNKQPNPLINTWFESDIALLNVATKDWEPVVENSSGDFVIDWSPDGKEILYSSNVANRESAYYANSRIFKLDLASKQSMELAADFDENKSIAGWFPNGIFFRAWQKTRRILYHIDPTSGAVTEFLAAPERINSVNFSKDGQQFVITGSGTDQVTEIYRSDVESKRLAQITYSSDQMKDWLVSDSEMVSWKSKDGAEIQGVLHKPQDFDPNKKYPLLVIIHGGPTGISTTKPLANYVYPMVQWLNKGAIILEPNYRGSAGYGADFRKLNVRNLGVGDAWDVLSGVDYLVEKGMVDTTKMGCMGWSQGGYISAFLTTTSNRFKAISVGAGISNWMTYYVNTDIHPFTRQYLKATPWSDEEIYKKTSPMTYINGATTPTLIQHGEFDRRVPVANAYELAQGLRDKGVENKLIIYNGFGHGISKPKERLAAVWHNWQWFNKYIWGEEVELPFNE